MCRVVLYGADGLRVVVVCMMNWHTCALLLEIILNPTKQEEISRYIVYGQICGNVAIILTIQNTACMEIAVLLFVPSGITIMRHLKLGHWRMDIKADFLLTELIMMLNTLPLIVGGLMPKHKAITNGGLFC